MNLVILGNLISLVGCLLMVAIGFIRRKEHILAAQCLQFGLMGLGNLVLGAVSGTISNIVGILRNLVFARWKSSLPLKIFFIAVQVLLSISALQSSALEWLPLLATAIFTWFLDTRSEITLKIVIIATLAMWLVYDFCHLNYVAMTFDALSILSNSVGIWMLKKPQKS